MRTVGIVQARMTSTRLPGKVLKDVLGKPLLGYELERLKRISSLDVLMVATTTNVDDDPVVNFCNSLDVPVYRGSEHDVLSRYYEAATEQQADTIVRFTADCPLIDPEISESVIRHYVENADGLDCCALDVTTYPRGMDTEVFPMHVLKDALELGHEEPDREHVTHYIYKRPGKYKIWMKQNALDWGGYRLTVDTAEDFALIKEIIERLYPKNKKFTLADIVKLLEQNPVLMEINEAVEQKKA